MICTVCLNIFSGKKRVFNPSYGTNLNVAHHETLEDLERAVDDGCVLCYKFLSFLIRKVGPGIRAKNEKYWFSQCTLAYSGQRGRYNLTLSAKVLASHTQESGRSDPFSNYTDIYVFVLELTPKTDKTYHLFTSRKVEDHDDSTISPPAWKRASTWYRNCLESHSGCRVGIDDKWFVPTRVLDLQDQFPGVRLVSRGDVSLGRPYATLSYCWGGVDFLKLKQSNSAELEAHISLGSLPMTFVQAIEVARRLSIPYLWIDSLCIVQDSTEDLQRELASMREVFGNSILNIMATASSNGFEGLFRARDPRALEILKITTTWDDEKSQEFVVVERNVWEEQLAEAPLIDRGWVVQERILPPRAVHFGQSQLFWECRELDACETHPNGLPWGLQDDLSKIKTLEPGIWHDFCQQKYLDEDKHNLDYRSPPCPQPYSGYDLWARIVQYYTRTKLSYASDKLIAIGGLAERMEYALGDTYLMGLWVQFLPSQLLWTVKDYQLSTRPSKYRAPSWSWFSMDGVISTTIPENGLRNLISVVDRPIVPSSGSDVADQASTNKIKLNGMIIPGQIAESSPGSDSYSLTLDGFGGLQGRSILSLDVQFSPESLQSVMCLPMDMQEETTCTQRIRTLILRKAEGRPKGWYERIGVVNNERGFGIRGSSDMGNKAADEEWPLLQAMKSHIIVGTDLYLDGEPGSLVIM